MSSPSSPSRRVARRSPSTRPPAARALALALALAGAACGGGSDPAPVTPLAPTPGTVAVVDGTGQSAVAGSALPAALRVRVGSAQGTPLAGVTVVFTVASGTATVSPASVVSDAQGLAATQVTLGATPGQVVITATVQGSSTGSTFTATATAPPTANGACATPATLPAVGEVRGATGVALCLPGGPAGAEYALVAFNADTTVATATLTVQGAGIAPTTSSVDRAAVAAVPAVTAADVARPTRASTPAELHARLHTRPRFVRPAVAGRPLAANADLGRNAAVGDLVSLNGNATTACASPRPRAGRVVAVGTRALVVEDTLNPAGGFTPADYAATAAVFDTLVGPLIAEQFSEPTDLDGNGRVVLFFTRTVNDLIPSGSGQYLGGYFLARDLFPREETALADGCATSNQGEVLYLLAPDPRASIRSNPFSTRTVLELLPRTLVHEYQHLVNASRHLYVNTGATDWEALWLDEGLSHIAEELLFYRVAGLAPRQNVDAAAILAADVRPPAFQRFQAGNVNRLGDYLASSTTSSLFSDDETAEGAGAIWSFLRYAADRQPGSGDGLVWRRLMNATALGFDNLRDVFGVEPATLFRDWAVSLLTDDLASTPAGPQQPSWQLRSVLRALGTRGVYPLNTLELAGGAPVSATLVPGGSVHLRFAVPQESSGAVQWERLPAGVQIALVRTR